MRFQNEQIRLIVDLYNKFGKIYAIDSNGDDEGAIYEETRKAILPQILTIIGPQGSGKSKLGQALCERTNCVSIDFSTFVKEKGLSKKDEETQTMALIKQLAKEVSPRVLIEEFPQTEF